MTFTACAVQSMLYVSTVPLLIPHLLLSTLAILIFNPRPFPGQTVALVLGCRVRSEGLCKCFAKDSGN